MRHKSINQSKEHSFGCALFVCGTENPVILHNIAQAIGAGDKQRTKQTIDTALCMSIILGVLITAFGEDYLKYKSRICRYLGRKK